jgi:hypothetical protein
MEVVNAIHNVRNVMDPNITTAFLVIFQIYISILMVVALAYVEINIMVIILPKSASLVRNLVRVAITLQSA